MEFLSVVQSVCISACSEGRTNHLASSFQQFLKVLTCVASTNRPSLQPLVFHRQVQLQLHWKHSRSLGPKAQFGLLLASSTMICFSVQPNRHFHHTFLPRRRSAILERWAASQDQRITFASAVPAPPWIHRAVQARRKSRE